MKKNSIFVFICLSLFPLSEYAQGKLFIIGGGDRPPPLMQSMLTAADLKSTDYIAVLPMSGSNPDTSYYYFNADIAPLCKNAVVNLNFTAQTVNIKSRLDSLKKAKLIFITGGDQDRFMNVVLKTPVFDAIHEAYKKGAMIAGTSAGAAVMSENMITGNELTDTVYHATFPKVVDNNIEIKKGLGLLTNAVIDQHFIVRSRYNRLLSAIAKFPELTCIGIDEETAVIIQGNKVKVSGNSQVVVISKPVSLKKTANGLIKFTEMRFSLYTDGDTFTISTSK